MIKLKKILFVNLFILHLLTLNCLAITNALIATVGNKPLTHLDLINEMKMMLIINGKVFSEENKKELQAVALESITRRLIKQIELEKYNFDDFHQEDIGKEINSIAARLNTNIDALKNNFAANNIDLSILENRIETELKWNGLIFNLYKNRVNINLDVINEQLKTIKDQNFIEEYLLYEILIESVEKEKLQEKINAITNEINNNGFEKTAIKYSQAESSTRGGKLGWVKETMISNRFKKTLKKTKVGNITKPFLMPEGALLLKLEEKRKIHNVINLEEAKNKLLQSEKKRKLDMFALSHFNKIRKTIEVNYNF